MTKLIRNTTTTLNEGGSLDSAGFAMICSDLIDKNPITLVGNFFAAVMQGDGNFVLYFAEGNFNGSADGCPRWASNTVGRGQPPYKFSLGGDGMGRVTDANGQVLWSSALRNQITQHPCRMQMQPDGNLVIYDARNVVLWASDTMGKGQC